MDIIFYILLGYLVVSLLFGVYEKISETIKDRKIVKGYKRDIEGVE